MFIDRDEEMHRLDQGVAEEQAALAGRGSAEQGVGATLSG
jgi:hypothetical protein